MKAACTISSNLITATLTINPLPEQACDVVDATLQLQTASLRLYAHVKAITASMRERNFGPGWRKYVCTWDIAGSDLRLVAVLHQRTMDQHVKRAFAGVMQLAADDIAAHIAALK